MSKIAIIVAMQKELELIGSLMSDAQTVEINGRKYTEGTVCGKEVVLTQCGIGKVNAACGTTELINLWHPKAIINSGIAGGIDDKTRVMDIIIGAETVYHDVWCGEGNEYGQVQGLPCRFAADENLYRAAKKLLPGGRIYGGLICSGDKFITDKTDLAAIKKQFPEGLAVDMESGAVAQSCYLRGVPFLSLRIISDTPGNTDNHAAQYENFWSLAPEKSAAVICDLLAAL